MAARCFSRPQSRVVGVLVEGAKVRGSVRQKPLDKKWNGCALLRSQQSHFPLSYMSIHAFVTRAATKSPKPNLHAPLTDSDQALDTELSRAINVIKRDQVPEEKEVEDALRICENLARNLTEPTEPPRNSPKPEKSPTSNLLSLEEDQTMSENSIPAEGHETMPIRTEIVDNVSRTAYSIITDPKVFITPMVLDAYVVTQSILGRPESFPHIFNLYASKPIPQPQATPIKYKNANPNRAASAIPLVLAHTALTAAIQKEDLPLALSIIETSVCTTAFKRNKTVRKALLPLSTLSLAPAAAYVLAQQLAQYQTSMDTRTSTQMAFMGIMAYVGFTAIIGVVAATTANDQMDRITWAKGTPLRERWLREEERALVDRVAGAWGFQDEYMRGEEESLEWEALREWAGRRGMVLDNPELMEGME